MRPCNSTRRAESPPRTVVHKSMRWLILSGSQEWQWTIGDFMVLKSQWICTEERTTWSTKTWQPLIQIKSSSNQPKTTLIRHVNKRRELKLPWPNSNKSMITTWVEQTLLKRELRKKRNSGKREKLIIKNLKPREKQKKRPRRKPMMLKTPNRKKRFKTLQPRPPIRKLPKRRLNRRLKKPRLMLKKKLKKLKQMLPRLPKIRLLMHLSRRRSPRLSQHQNHSKKLTSNQRHQKKSIRR